MELRSEKTDLYIEAASMTVKTSSKSPLTRLWAVAEVRLAFGCLGIYLFYSVYSIVQEKMCVHASFTVLV